MCKYKKVLERTTTVRSNPRGSICYLRKHRQAHDLFERNPEVRLISSSWNAGTNEESTRTPGIVNRGIRPRPDRGLEDTTTPDSRCGTTYRRVHYRIPVTSCLQVAT